jgi:hypothetical protein
MPLACWSVSTEWSPILIWFVRLAKACRLEMKLPLALICLFSENNLYMLNLTEPYHTDYICKDTSYEDKLQSEKNKTERGSEGPGLVLSAESAQCILLEREDLGTMLLCPGKMFRQGN